MRGMILAAGLGTRFKPWTDKHPKALAMVHGKSLLQRNIEFLQHYGIYELVVNVHHFAEQIEEAIAENNGWGSVVHISDERNEILETGGGLLKAKPLLEGSPFVIINVDVLTDLDLHSMIHKHTTCAALATLAVSDRETSRYFLFNESMNLCGWRNTKTGEERVSRTADHYLQKAFSGVHIIDPQIFDFIEQEGKFSMVDVYLSLAADHTICGFDHTGSKFMDVGKPGSVEEAERLFEG